MLKQKKYIALELWFKHAHSSQIANEKSMNLQFSILEDVLCFLYLRITNLVNQKWLHDNI